VSEEQAMKVWRFYRR